MPNARTLLVLVAHGLLVWILCGAAMWIGLAVASLDVALVAHAAAAPIVASLVSYAYYRRFGGTTPLATAAVVLAVVILVDLFLVAMVINRSFDMFRSALGTWLPFALIFTATYATGVLVARRR